MAANALRTLVAISLVIGASVCVAEEEEGAGKLVDRSAAAYTEYLGPLDVRLIESVEAAAERYASNVANLSATESDAWYAAFKRFFHSFIEAYNDHLWEIQNPGGEWADITRKIEAEEGRLNRAGLDLLESEGYYYVAERAGFMLGLFGGHVTEPVRRYLETRDPELKTVFQEDAALRVSWEELGDRVAAWDKYLREYEASPARGDAEELRKVYTSALFTGTNNTRVLDDCHDDRSKSKIRAAYKRVIEKHAETPLAGLLSTYLELLEKSGYQNTAEIRAFLKSGRIEFMYGSRWFVR